MKLRGWRLVPAEPFSRNKERDNRDAREVLLASGERPGKPLAEDACLLAGVDPLLVEAKVVDGLQAFSAMNGEDDAVRAVAHQPLELMPEGEGVTDLHGIKPVQVEDQGAAQDS